VTSSSRHYIFTLRGGRKIDTTLENNKNIAIQDYFLLVIRNWNDKLEDYLPVDDPSTATQTFSEYLIAESNYFSTKYESCPQAGGKDVKVELFHMRFGIAHMVRNRILFP
jgi:hypothetical protein